MRKEADIAGLDFNKIRESLSLDPFEQFMSANEGRGRTTRMLVSCLVRMSQGKKVAVLAPTPIVGDSLIRKLDEYCVQIQRSLGIRIHGLARWVINSSHVDKNEFFQIDHSCDKSGVVK